MYAGILEIEMQDTKPPRLLHSIEGTREILGDVGRTMTYDLINTGKLTKVKIGTRSFITDSSIRALVCELESRTA